jgi:serine/threonine-protein kinase
MLGRAVGNYAVEKKLGEGGMGAVYRLKHTALPNTYKVLKTLLRSGGSESAMQRFQQEAHVAPIVGTERVVRVDDFGSFPDGTPYIVMEYIEGGDLGGYLASNGPLPVDAALKLVFRVADTLAVAHSKGIVHRDLKPANILLEAGTLRPKLADWGVARASGAGKLAHTAERVVIGTPGYMAPEMALGLETDARIDIFSLGVIVYELLTGQRPFPQTMPGTLALFQQFLAAPIPTIASMRPAHMEPAAPIVEQLVAKAIAKDVQDRYPTMVAFRDAITNALQWMADQSGVPKLAMATMLSAHADSSGPTPTLRAKAGEVAALIERYATPTPRPTVEGYASGQSQPASLPPSQIRSRSPIGIVLALLGVGAAAVAVYLLLKPQPHSLPAATPPPVEAAAPAAAPTIGRFLVTSIPVGATVSVDGRAVGTTPVIVSGKPGETKKVHLSMAGFDDKDADIEFASDDRKAEFQLTAHVEQRAATPKSPKTSEHSKHRVKTEKPAEGAVNPWQ